MLTLNFWIKAIRLHFIFIESLEKKRILFDVTAIQVQNIVSVLSLFLACFWLITGSFILANLSIGIHWIRCLYLRIYYFAAVPIAWYTLLWIQFKDESRGIGGFCLQLAFGVILTCLVSNMIRIWLCRFIIFTQFATILSWLFDIGYDNWMISFIIRQVQILLIIGWWCLLLFDLLN